MARLEAALVLLACSLLAGPLAGQSELPEPHRRWLEDEVPYIIAPEECAAFLALEGSDERARFVESFWQRRDPTPDSPQNEFKQEHYRRIAYADDRYDPSRPGRLTEQGRAYIVLGPPDEIEVHPAGGEYRPASGRDGFAAAYPFEIWRYRGTKMSGSDTLIMFVDEDSDGEHKLHGKWDIPAALLARRGCP